MDGVKKMVLVDFKEYNHMKRRLEEFLGQERLQNNSATPIESKDINNDGVVDGLIGTSNSEINHKNGVEEREEDKKQKDLNRVEEGEEAKKQKDLKQVESGARKGIRNRKKKIVYGGGKKTLKLPRPGLPENPSYRILGKGGSSGRIARDKKKTNIYSGAAEKVDWIETQAKNIGVVESHVKKGFLECTETW